MDSNADPDWEEIKAVLTNKDVPFRLWTYPDPKLTHRQQKQIAELGVTKHYCEAIETMENRRIFKEIRINENDPPDTIVEKLNGHKIGVEVTELLDEEVQKRRVKTWRKEKRQYERKRWEPEELLNELQKRIDEKSAYHKPEFKEGPYDSKVLVIYSVDLSVQLYFRNWQAILSEREFRTTLRFDEIFFLTAQAPTQRYPQLCKLRLKWALNEN